MSSDDCIAISSSDEEDSSKLIQKKAPTLTLKSVEDIKNKNLFPFNGRSTIKKRVTPIQISSSSSSTWCPSPILFTAIGSSSKASTSKLPIFTNSSFSEKQISASSTNSIERCLSSAPSTSVASPEPSLHPNYILFEKFVTLCRKTERSSDMEKIIKKLCETFNAASVRYKESNAFGNLINEQLQLGSSPLFKVYISIKCVRDELKFNKVRKVEKTENAPSESISSKKQFNENNQNGNSSMVENCYTTEKQQDDDDSDADSLYGIDENKRKQIRKLEKIMRALNKAIVQLEERDVDWDDEEESAYIKLDRFRGRFVKVYEKVCQLRKRAADADRPVKRKVSFQGSGYPDIDKLVEKMYNHRKEFPDFHDVYEIVKEVKKSDKLLPDKIHRIAEKVFKEFGMMLKRRRQRDDYDVMCSYLPNAIDPASNNIELNQKLSDNYEIFKKKEEEVINSYAEKEIIHGLKAEEVTNSGDEQENSDDDDEVEEEEDQKDKVEEERDDDSTTFEEKDSDTDKDKDEAGFGKMTLLVNEEDIISNKKRTYVVNSDSDDSASDNYSKKRRKIHLPNLDNTLLEEVDFNKTDGDNVNIINGGSCQKVNLDSRKPLIAESKDFFSSQKNCLQEIDPLIFTSEKVTVNNKVDSPNSSSIKVEEQKTVERNKDNNTLENSEKLVRKFELLTKTKKKESDKSCNSPDVRQDEVKDVFDRLKSILDNSDEMLKNKCVSSSKTGDGSDVSDDDCVIEKVNICSSSDQKPPNFYAGNSSEDVDVVFEGKFSTEDDEVRIITPGKKIKRSKSIVDISDDSQVPLMKIENIFTVYQTKLTDFVKPLATSTLSKKVPVVNKTIKNVKSSNSQCKKLNQIKLPQTDQNCGTSKDSGVHQTARVIFDGNRAEYVSKNSAKKVLSMGNTKVFTKGVKNSKFINSDEIITVD